MADAMADETILNSEEPISVAPPAQEIGFRPFLKNIPANKNSSMLAKDRRTVGDFLGLTKKMCSRNDAKISLKDILNFEISGKIRN